MNTIQIVIIMLLPIAALLEAHADAAKSNPDHLLSALVRIAAATLLSSICTPDLFTAGLFTFILLTYYFILFDPLYNVSKCDYIWKIGTTAVTDKLAQKLGADGKGWMALKGVVLSLLLTAYYYV